MALFYEGKKLDLDNEILGSSRDIDNTRFCIAGAPQGITGGLSSDCDYFIYKEEGNYDGLTMYGTGIYSRKNGKVVKPSTALRIKNSRLVPLFGDVCVLEYRDKVKPNAQLYPAAEDYEEYIDHIVYQDVEEAVEIMLQNNMKLPVSSEQFYNIVSEIKRKRREEKVQMDQESSIEEEHSHRL